MLPRTLHQHDHVEEYGELVRHLCRSPRPSTHVPQIAARLLSRTFRSACWGSGSSGLRWSMHAAKARAMAGSSAARRVGSCQEQRTCASLIAVPVTVPTQTALPSCVLLTRPRCLARASCPYSTRFSFQLMFCSTTATIVSGAVASRYGGRQLLAGRGSGSRFTHRGT